MTAAQLMNPYEKSVGRNASLLLYVPPAPDGRIAAADVASLTAFGKEVRRIYGSDVREQGPGSYTFDRVAVREDIRHGQRVERSTAEARIDGAWQRIAEGATIGHERLLPLPEAVTATAVRVRVLEPRAKPHLGATTLHFTTTPAGRLLTGPKPARPTPGPDTRAPPERGGCRRRTAAGPASRRCSTCAWPPPAQ